MTRIGLIPLTALLILGLAACGVDGEPLPPPGAVQPYPTPAPTPGPAVTVSGEASTGVVIGL